MNKDHLSRQNTKMPWGKFKGIFIKELPDWYIEWASVNYEDMERIKQYKTVSEYLNKPMTREMVQHICTS